MLSGRLSAMLSCQQCENFKKGIQPSGFLHVPQFVTKIDSALFFFFGLQPEPPPPPSPSHPVFRMSCHPLAVIWFVFKNGVFIFENLNLNRAAHHHGYGEWPLTADRWPNPYYHCISRGFSSCQYGGCYPPSPTKKWLMTVWWVH